ncbi:2794_t:CDS:2, partial [Funneliformis mosseae]
EVKKSNSIKLFWNQQGNIMESEIIEEKPNCCGLDLSKLSTGDDVPTSKRKRKRGDYENFNSRSLKDITFMDKDDSEEKDDER